MLTQDQIDEWDRPEPEQMIAPWVVEDCPCSDPKMCNDCDGAGWFYSNPTTAAKVSPMMQDALDRHG
jgi:hypothetical protein